MEYDNEETLGGGIITLSVLHFIASALSIIGGIIFIITSNSSSDFKNQLQSLGLDISTGTIVFEDIILRIVLIISLILLLKKNKIGIYGYFLFAIVSVIASIVTAGFNIFSVIIGLIFPVLMAVFIYKKKSLFGFN